MDSVKIQTFPLVMSNFNKIQQLREKQEKDLAEVEERLNDAWKNDHLLNCGTNIGLIRFVFSNNELQFSSKIDDI